MSDNKSGMLLFCKEQTIDKYALYFVDFSTLTSKSPCVHRFYAKRGIFMKMLPGNCYTIALSNMYIKQCKLEREYMISQPYYALLMELKQVAFGNNNGAIPKRFDAARYYSFEELRSLLEYSEPPLLSALRSVCTYFFMALSALLPSLLYFFYLYYLLKNPPASKWAAPMLAICILPTIFAMMYVLHVWIESLLLRLPFTRYHMLQQYTLRNAGARRPIRIPSQTRMKLLRVGLTCFGIFILSNISLLIK